jgi:Mg2+-importing ATPase
MVGAVAWVAVRFSEGREFVRLVARAHPRWMLLTLFIQTATYFFQGGIWRLTVRTAGAALSLGESVRLAVARLFMDQALPTAGLSGTLVMIKALEQHGVPLPVVMAGVVIDTVSCYATYVVGVIAALIVLAVSHEASRVVIVAAVPFALFSTAIVVGFLALAGRPINGPIATRLARLRPLGRGMAFLGAADRGLARNPRLLLAACACQATIVLLDAATIAALIAALGAKASLGGVFASYMISTMFRLVAVLPGGLGTFEASSVLTLKLIGVDLPVALSATLLYRGLSFWLPLVPGLWFSRRYAPRRNKAHR